MARVLIIEGNLLIRTLLVEILRGGGHDVVGEARDGMEAVTRCRELRPQLVTLALVLPKRDGLATLGELRRVDPSLPVIICSAWLTERRVIAALRLGARGFIAKPFDRATVLEAVRQIGVVAEPISPPPAPARTVDVSDHAGSGRDERREFDRVNVELPVMVRSRAATAIDTITIDISGSGMQVATDTLPPETIVRFWIELRERETPIEGRARVIRTGTGVQALAFERISIADHERLIAFIHQRQSSTRSEVD